MPIMAVAFGILLTGLAMYGFFGADPDHQSPTAWIPAAVGVPLIACGLIALSEKWRKHAMHLAALLALLGTLAAGGRGFSKIGVLFAEDGEGNRRAVVMVLAMFVVCAVFLGLCVKSFIDARRRAK